MKHRRYGFTLIELLTVLGVMAVLVGVLIPAVNMVRRTAKNTAQKAQFASIDMGLMAFKADHGDYPESYMDTTPGQVYCGAQKLAEALVGWDLLGFHPDSDFRALGSVADGGEYDAEEIIDPTNLDERKGPYLELATANVYRVGNLGINKPGLFNNTTVIAPDTFVLCDVFGMKKINIGLGKTVRAGSPILYYKANTTSKTIELPAGVVDRIYNAFDNIGLVAMMNDPANNPKGDHILDNNFENLYMFDYEGGIKDTKVWSATGKAWPHRPDSYILISAGADGLYGTSDDIRNF